MKVVGCIHGINTDPVGRSLFAGDWQATLHSAGVRVRCVPIPWSSYGSSPRDIAGLLTDTGNRWSAEVMRHLDRVQPDIVIAHSGGTVLMNGRVSCSPVLGRVPVLAIGSPFGHGPFAAALNMAGWKPLPLPVYEFWNQDDPIACAVTHRTPKPWRSFEVKYPGHTNEHFDRFYLGSQVVANTLLALGADRA